MGFIKNKFFVLMSLIFLQSCSGGRIGNFLDASFKNIEETKIKEDVKNNLKKKIVIKSGGTVKKNKNIEETKIKKDLKNKVLKNSEEKSKNNKKIPDKNIPSKKRIFQPKSYKIIFILKDVDPKDPTKELRTILRNSDVNFEIEKIERYFDPKNKTIKSN